MQERSLRSLSCTRLLLSLLKPGEGHKEVFVYMFLPKELHRPLVHLPAVGDVAVLLFEASVLDPVFHLRVNDDKCSEVKANAPSQRS